jgi:hypothetical protein
MDFGVPECQCISVEALSNCSEEYVIKKYADKRWVAAAILPFTPIDKVYKTQETKVIDSIVGSGQLRSKRPKGQRLQRHINGIKPIHIPSHGKDSDNVGVLGAGLNPLGVSTRFLLGAEAPPERVPPERESVTNFKQFCKESPHPAVTVEKDPLKHLILAEHMPCSPKRRTVEISDVGTQTDRD